MCQAPQIFISISFFVGRITIEQILDSFVIAIPNLFNGTTRDNGSFVKDRYLVRYLLRAPTDSSFYSNPRERDRTTME